MTTRRTTDRNSGVFSLAIAQDRAVRFTYTDEAGVRTRRTVKPTGIKATRHSDRGVLVIADENTNVRSFRSDRVERASLI